MFHGMHLVALLALVGVCGVTAGAGWYLNRDLRRRRGDRR